MFSAKSKLLVLIITIFARLSNNALLSNQEQKRYKPFLEGQGLYTPDDDVVILTVHNFKSSVMNSRQGWLVEFYNSWCGFCQRFAPSWKALATDVKGWSDLVRIAALDCSVDENTPLCREYEIMSYPTLRYFHENYQSGPQNLGISVQKGADVNSHRQNLVKRLTKEQEENRGRQYPDLILYQHSTLEHLFDNVPGDVQFAFLIVESPESYLGEEVSLDLHKTTSIVIRHTFANNTALVNSLGVNTIPAMVVLDRSNNFKILASVDSRLGMKKSITEYLANLNVKVTDETPKQEIFTGRWLDVKVPDMSSFIQERARQVLKERIKRMGDVVFQMDLETALRYSLKHEIATNKIIEGVKLKVLRDYLSLLRRYFPFGNAGQLFLTELSVKANSTDLVRGHDLAEIIQRAELVESQVYSSPNQWLACRGSSPRFRGYPCGLWKMFHYLTVNSADRNAMHRHADPLEVLNVMFGYVKYFFGCQDCSQHFQEMAQRREMRNVASLNSSVVWLWMAHNEVNKRLAGDQTEDPEYPKIQFPSKENCPACRYGNNTWNVEEVGGYLRYMYNNLNIRYIGVDTTVLHSGLYGRPTSRASGNIFRALDMSMCFILYVCSFLLLAVLIRLFLKRGYRKKPYSYDILGKV